MPSLTEPGPCACTDEYAAARSAAPRTKKREAFVMHIFYSVHPYGVCKGGAGFMEEQTAQRQGILRRDSVRIVVEVRVHRTSVSPLRRERRRPLFQSIVRITSRVVSARPMKTDVRNRADERLEDRGPAFVMQTERRVVTFEQSICL